MRVVLLTTDTTHHTYWAARLAERFPPAAIVIETRPLPVPFPVRHPFEDERDEYERSVLLAGGDTRLADIAPTIVAESANDVARNLEALAPDVALLFGTGRLDPAVIRIPSVACLNLHGGDPERYRGLDSHLWAIYHRDFGGLVTALHHVDAELDTGAIVALAPVPVSRGMRLAELRARNTEVCLGLSAAALAAVDAGVPAASRPQRKRGRYYGTMPAVLKELCVGYFHAHTASL